MMCTWHGRWGHVVSVPEGSEPVAASGPGEPVASDSMPPCNQVMGELCLYDVSPLAILPLPPECLDSKMAVGDPLLVEVSHHERGLLAAEPLGEAVAALPEVQDLFQEFSQDVSEQGRLFPAWSHFSY